MHHCVANSCCSNWLDGLYVICAKWWCDHKSTEMNSFEFRINWTGSIAHYLKLTNVQEIGWQRAFRKTIPYLHTIANKKTHVEWMHEMFTMNAINRATNSRMNRVPKHTSSLTLQSHGIVGHLMWVNEHDIDTTYTQLFLIMIILMFRCCFCCFFSCSVNGMKHARYKFSVCRLPSTLSIRDKTLSAHSEFEWICKCAFCGRWKEKFSFWLSEA